MRVTLLGTGDTTGTPTVGCDCDTCAAARERGVSRSRFSVHVANERTGESLLVDFSPDFRSQFLDNDVPLPDAGIVTHIHFDHLDGLGNVYRLVDGLPVHAPSETIPRPTRASPRRSEASTTTWKTGSASTPATRSTRSRAAGLRFGSSPSTTRRSCVTAS